jgi:5,10-methylenetetrahydromethanopterin reductase
MALEFWTMGIAHVAFAPRAAMRDGSVRTPIDEDSKQVLEQVHASYDMHQHTRAGSPQAGRLTDEFVDRFGIVGPPEHCVRRLRELVDLGIDRSVVVGPSIDADRELARRAIQTFVREVLPALKEATHVA